MRQTSHGGAWKETVNKKILIIITSLAVLACSTSAAVLPPRSAAPVPFGTVAESGRAMRVIAEQALWVRDNPNGRQLYTISNGKLVYVYGSIRIVGDTTWCQIGDGLFVACRYLANVSQH